LRSPRILLEKLEIFWQKAMMGRKCRRQEVDEMVRTSGFKGTLVRSRKDE
jgi:hypothetical protein